MNRTNYPKGQSNDKDTDNGGEHKMSDGANSLNGITLEDLTPRQST